MKNTTIRKKDKLAQRSFRKRLCSVAVASTIFATSMPAVPWAKSPSSQLTAHAANKDSFILYTDPNNDITAASDGLDDGKYSIEKPDDLVRYSKCYISFPANHQNDILELGFAAGDTTVAAAEYIALGTEQYPFNGTIITAAGSLNKLNLPEALFDYVADTAKIVESDDTDAGPSYIRIARMTNNTNEPILARHVWHNPNAPTTIAVGNSTESWNGNTWQVQIETYSDGTNAAKSNNYAGIIGEMQKGSKLQLDLRDGTSAEIKGDSDLGRICGSMGRNTMLTVKSIEGITTSSDDEPPVVTTATNNAYGISTSSGNVGGIVGSMDNGSVLVVKQAPANTAAAISIDLNGSGYAGGIVGKNDGGFVDTSAISSYSIGSTITGRTGAGGLFGYNRPLFDDPRTSLPESSVTYDLANYSVNATVSGSGNMGGLFGELVNKSVTIDDSGNNETRTDAAGGTIEIKNTSGSNTITVTNSSSASNLGGIAGRYTPFSLTETLSVSNVTVSITNSGSYSENYGGGIGLVGVSNETASPAYVSFNNFNATATNCGSRYFGGMVGKGDESFVDANTVTVTADNFRGGAAVGCMARGVLKLAGTVNLANAKPAEIGVDAIREGQIVGYRDDALVYYDGAASGLSISSKRVDNIGTWGDILILDGTKIAKSAVLTEGTHSITMVAPSSSITTPATYATQALAMQIAYSNNPIITNSTVSAPSTISFGSSASIDLSDTGLRGLTRDNKINAEDTKCNYTGTITGNSATVKLNIENIGGNPVYRHSYNGFLGIADTVSIGNLTFYGKINLQPCVGMYAGMAAAISKTSFTVNTVNVATSGTAANAVFTTHYEVDGDHKWGSSDLYLGRLVGNVDGSISVTGGTYSGTVSGDATSEESCYGGVVGRINGTTSSAFSGVTISGSMSNTGANKVQKIGGLVAEIVKGDSESRLNLDNITVSSLTVNGNASESSGGLLGYGWYNTSVQGVDISSAENGMTIAVSGTNKVSVTDGATSPAVKNGATAGLVYCATGRWLVNSIAFSGFTVDMNSDSSFGMLVNQGRSGDDGIYMLLPSGFTYTISGNPFSTHTGVYDELVAYSASGDVTVNGQGVVSIHSTDDALVMTGTGAGNTYTARTALGQGKSNSNTRYYYNLDTIATDDASSSSNEEKLMNWGLHQYACGNIQKYFDDPYDGKIEGVTTGEGESATTDDEFNMVGYSWYPVDVDDTLEVNGTFKFYNSEIEKNIQGKSNTKYSTLSSTQHYLMQNALFNNVNSKLTVGTVTLQGNVGKANGVSGALVFGTVMGTASSDAGTAEVNVTGGITLDGIHVHNFDPTSGSEYAPLLINQTSDFSKLTIKNVVVAGDSSYKTSAVATLKTKNKVTGSSTYDATTYPKIATSLIGNAGVDANSKNINVSFEEIQLDGRINGTLNTNNDLTGAYHSVESLFTKATLLNKLQYQSGGGTYNFARTEDWTANDHTPAKVTYGSEISDSTERKENFGKEFWYYDGKTTDGNGFTTGNYILPETYSPSNGNASASKTGNVVSWTAPYSFSGFLPYVYTKYIGAANGGVSGAHQLNVNHTSAAFSGCGTYNDPYLITSGDDLLNIENIINGDYGDISLASISLPTKTSGSGTVFDETATWDGTTAHKSYSKTGSGESITYDNGTESIDLTTLRTYLAGAYYKIENDIVISSDKFGGLGNISNKDHTFAVFRGVIVGSGNETIVNKTSSPLIASSYGSVVKGLTIEVGDATNNVEVSRSNGTATTQFTPESGTGCAYYGAVIGQIFGGDNIIDNVYVDFTNATVTISGAAAHVIPVGGYVGVLLNGGLYFRNMATNNNIAGLPNDKTFKGTEHLITKEETVDGQTVTKPNMKYLYVNPIIGRVMNGFAIYETMSGNPNTATDRGVFRPFENGTRTYPDGSKVYQKQDGSFVEVAAGATFNQNLAVGVTMKNGTKNYSIADINRNDTANNFTMTAPSGGNPGDAGSIIGVSNAQSLFIVSLVTEAGLGTSVNCKYDDTNNLLKPYTNYMSTRLSDYEYVGSASLTGSAPSGMIENPSTDADKAKNDYYISTGDIHSDSSSNSTKVPHLVKAYTPYGNSYYPYPAFNLAAFTGKTVGCELYLNMELSDSGDTTYYMPDGFRGLGCLLLGQGTWHDSYRLYNIMCLNSFYGNNRIISMNMQLLLYGSDNYGTPNENQAYLKTGYGFFNAVRSNYNNDDTHKFKDLTLKGSVKYDLIDSTTGGSIVYNKTNVTGNARPAVGGFIGAPGVDTQVNSVGDGGGGAMYFENIRIENISVYGVKYSGGIVGCSNAGDSGGTIIYTFKGCSADNITIKAGQSAGGMVGYVRNMYSVIDADFEGKEYGVIEIMSMSKEAFNDNNQGMPTSGGLVGDYGGKSNTANLKIKNVTIKNASSTSKGAIGCDTYNGTLNIDYPRIGGILGGSSRDGKIEYSNVKVSNIDFNGMIIGGLIGYCGGGQPVTITDASVFSDQGCEMYNYRNNNNSICGCGGVIGYLNKTALTTIKNTTVTGYTISSPQNAGGLIGRKDQAYNVVMDNISVTGATIKNTTKSGGLIGWLNGGELLGYNILTNNITFEKFASSNMSNCGQIVGYNNSQVIKIVGFSRQGTGIQAKMVGNKNANATDQYGSGGYVIFADYIGVSLDESKRGAAFSNYRFTGTGNTANISDTSLDPYVIVNPKRIVSDDGKFLIGDGVYNSSNDSAYASSAIARIISDASGTSVAKRYQSYGSDGYALTSNNADDTTMLGLLRDQKKYSTYKAARTSTNLPPELYNMPVLVVDDISSDNTTKLVNTYLRLLTNTNYNYAALDEAIGKVRLATCTYTKSGDDYNLSAKYSTDNNTGVNLKIDLQDEVFKIGGAYDNSDMTKEQFTLIDIEFYDPASVTYKSSVLQTNNLKTAYHLYVPVFVKKMLHFKFTSAAISGTTYRTEPYKQALADFGRTAIIENLGNPITMQFSWTYEQNFNEWMDLINAGEKINRAYDKQLEFTDHTLKGLPNGTQMVLVDANRNNPCYYAEKTTAGLITDDTARAITCLNLNVFKKSDNTTLFTPIEFNDFFDVLDSAPTTDVYSYTQTTSYFVDASSNSTESTIRTNSGTLYMPCASGTSGAKKLYIRYKAGMSNNSGQLVETYYLTFFTPTPTTADVYHLEFNGPKTFGGTEYPSNYTNRIETHIFTGDIFENSCNITTSGSSEMSAKGNNSLTATMTANVGLKAAAGNIIKTFINYDSVSIYQSFLMQLNQSYYTDAAMNNLTSEKGIAKGSNPQVEVSAYTVNGAGLDSIPNSNSLASMSGANAIINANYLELRSLVNLKSYLYTAYIAYQKGTASDTKFPLVATVKLTYSDDDKIQAQFPENTKPDSEKGQYIGTNVTGSSNISSQAAAAAYSKTSKPGGDNTKYYRKTTKKATLSYYSADTEVIVVTPAHDDVAAVTENQMLVENKYEQFGINAIDPVRDTDATSVLNMKTQADYNILNLSEEAKDSIKSMKVTVSLRRKSDYEDTGKLPIEQFFVPNSLTLYQKEVKTLNPATFTKTTSTDTDFVYYVNCTKDDFTGNIYYIPIYFQVYTGDNSKFENTTYGGSTHRYYSNYMVKIKVELFDGTDGNGTLIPGSDIDDHIIYTNARIYSETVPSTPPGSSP